MIERGWPPDFVLSMDIAEFMEWYERYKAIDGAQRTLSKG